ncbi:ATP synthase F1 subunit gamma [Roseibacillus persicicus]|uniref:ATP synthase gamma chain n=1 Tax=Roseibacillus persicicus TaxID=454148 RepID=A0A918WKI5_9BACT|nr:ATP synthase F1 subunit gamma [Roseibacillus persicicus]MDQ8191345.1 ATP synthase F1 subunit gamma [Roseibacillus persicicus]GHC54816.1 ATP synthase subunit gamma [Roseibacillus persicicus]
MANLRDIRRRIKSVKNTAQITRAMQLVAAAKMKKAQDQALAGRDYADLLNQVLVNLKENVDEEAHALLEKRDGGKELVLVISTDKGLCGALNTNLLKKVRSQTSSDAEYVTVGRKLREQLAKSGGELVADFEVADPAPFVEARPIATLLTKLFLEGKYGKISVAFTNFVTTLNQEPTVVQLLPIDADTVGEKQDYEGVGNEVKETDHAAALGKDYLFEPSSEDVLDTLLPLYINFQVYQMIIESRASEHSARMVAMKAATDNAKKMTKELTLQYNKARQAAITAELLEITTAMKAME